MNKRVHSLHGKYIFSSKENRLVRQRSETYESAGYYESLEGVPYDEVAQPLPDHIEGNFRKLQEQLKELEEDGVESTEVYKRNILLLRLSAVRRYAQLVKAKNQEEREEKRELLNDCNERVSQFIVEMEAISLNKRYRNKYRRIKADIPDRTHLGLKTDTIPKQAEREAAMDAHIDRIDEIMDERGLLGTIRMYIDQLSRGQSGVKEELKKTVDQYNQLVKELNDKYKEKYGEDIGRKPLSPIPASLLSDEWASDMRKVKVGTMSNEEWKQKHKDVLEWLLEINERVVDRTNHLHGELNYSVDDLARMDLLYRRYVQTIADYYQKKAAGDDALAQRSKTRIDEIAKSMSKLADDNVDSEDRAVRNAAVRMREICQRHEKNEDLNALSEAARASDRDLPVSNYESINLTAVLVGSFMDQLREYNEDLDFRSGADLKRLAEDRKTIHEETGVIVPDIIQTKFRIMLELAGWEHLRVEYVEAVDDSDIWVPADTKKELREDHIRMAEKHIESLEKTLDSLGDETKEEVLADWVTDNVIESYRSVRRFFMPWWDMDDPPEGMVKLQEELEKIVQPLTEDNLIAEYLLHELDPREQDIAFHELSDEEQAEVLKLLEEPGVRLTMDEARNVVNGNDNKAKLKIWFRLKGQIRKDNTEFERAFPNWQKRVQKAAEVHKQREIDLGSGLPSWVFWTGVGAGVWLALNRRPILGAPLRYVEYKVDRAVLYVLGGKHVNYQEGKFFTALFSKTYKLDDAAVALHSVDMSREARGGLGFDRLNSKFGKKFARRFDHPSESGILTEAIWRAHGAGEMLPDGSWKLGDLYEKVRILMQYGGLTRKEAMYLCRIGVCGPYDATSIALLEMRYEAMAAQRAGRSAGRSALRAGVDSPELLRFLDDVPDEWLRSAELQRIRTARTGRVNGFVDRAHGVADDMFDVATRRCAMNGMPLDDTLRLLRSDSAYHALTILPPRSVEIALDAGADGVERVGRLVAGVTDSVGSVPTKFVTPAPITELLGLSDEAVSPVTRMVAASSKSPALQAADDIMIARAMRNMGQSAWAKAGAFAKTLHIAGCALDIFALCMDLKALEVAEGNLRHIIDNMGAQLNQAGFAEVSRGFYRHRETGVEVKMESVTSYLQNIRNNALLRVGADTAGLSLLAPTIAFGPAGWAIAGVVITVHALSAFDIQKATKEFLEFTPTSVLALLGTEGTVGESTTDIIAGFSNGQMTDILASHKFNEWQKELVRKKMFILAYFRQLQQIRFTDPKVYKTITGGKDLTEFLDDQNGKLFFDEFERIIGKFGGPVLFTKSEDGTVKWKGGFDELKTDSGWFDLENVSGEDIGVVMTEAAYLHAAYLTQQRHLEAVERDRVRGEKRQRQQQEYEDKYEYPQSNFQFCSLVLNPEESATNARMEYEDSDIEFEADITGEQIVWGVQVKDLPVGENGETVAEMMLQRAHEQLDNPGTYVETVTRSSVPAAGAFPGRSGGTWKENRTPRTLDQFRKKPQSFKIELPEGVMPHLTGNARKITLSQLSDLAFARPEEKDEEKRAEVIKDEYDIVVSKLKDSYERMRYIGVPFRGPWWVKAAHYNELKAVGHFMRAHPEFDPGGRVAKAIEDLRRWDWDNIEMFLATADWDFYGRRNQAFQRVVAMVKRRHDELIKKRFDLVPHDRDDAFEWEVIAGHPHWIHGEGNILYVAYEDENGVEKTQRLVVDKVGNPDRNTIETVKLDGGMGSMECKTRPYLVKGKTYYRYTWKFVPAKVFFDRRRAKLERNNGQRHTKPLDYRFYIFSKTEAGSERGGEWIKMREGIRRSHIVERENGGFFYDAKNFGSDTRYLWYQYLRIEFNDGTAIRGKVNDFRAGNYDKITCTNSGETVSEHNVRERLSGMTMEYVKMPDERTGILVRTDPNAEIRQYVFEQLRYPTLAHRKEKRGLHGDEVAFIPRTMDIYHELRKGVAIRRNDYYMSVRVWDGEKIQVVQGYVENGKVSDSLKKYLACQPAEGDGRIIVFPINANVTDYIFKRRSDMAEVGRGLVAIFHENPDAEPFTLKWRNLNVTIRFKDRGVVLGKLRTDEMADLDSPLHKYMQIGAGSEGQSGKGVMDVENKDWEWKIQTTAENIKDIIFEDPETGQRTVMRQVS